MSRVRSAEQRGVASRVLIVDDDRDARTLVATALELAGHTSIQAESADEALRVLDAEQVDAVILDRAMPGTDGIECLRLIRQSTDTVRIPVVMVTASAGNDEIVAALDLGADDYITKPFAPGELVARVMRLIRGHAEWVSLLRDEAHRRTALLSAAASSSTTTTVEQGAMDLAEELYSLDDARGAAMIELIGDDVVVLASKGDDPMGHITSALHGKDLGAYLNARATLGLWLEPITDPTSSSVVSLVPIRVDDVVVGLV
ncbi:MAG: response regulator, partial [Acidimicrobiales bacterium]|nr:response regulator [Acidimicrobiales bacterium]